MTVYLKKYYSLEKCNIVRKFSKSISNLNSTDLTQWSLENVADTPQKPDGHNCGVLCVKTLKVFHRKKLFNLSI